MASACDGLYFMFLGSAIEVRKTNVLTRKGMATMMTMKSDRLRLNINKFVTFCFGRYFQIVTITSKFPVTNYVFTNYIFQIFSGG